MSQRNLYIGLISGTSMDGIDAALLQFDGGLQIQHSLFVPYSERCSGALRELLRDAAHCGLDALGELDQQIGREFADAAIGLLRQAGVDRAHIAAIGSHGQTVRHRPADGAETFAAYTMQIGDPNVIAERTGITTVSDFRRRDMAAGGQGAPLVPAFHASLFGSGQAAAIVNLGGIANITIVGSDGQVFGFDTGPANCLLDQWSARHFGVSFDAGGKLAATGQTQQQLLARLLDDPYFKQAHPKSTGPEYFNLDWLAPHLAGLDCGAQDVLRTLLVLTAASVAAAMTAQAPGTGRVYLCGGGVHNDLLLQELQSLLPAHAIQTTAALGVDPDFVEACAFAWLARQTLLGEPGNIPAVTGARRAVPLGGIYRA